MLEFYGPLRTNPPAISASGAFGHVVQDGSPIAFIHVLKRTRRAILNACKTAGTLVVNLKKRHVLFSVIAISLVPIHKSILVARVMSPK